MKLYYAPLSGHSHRARLMLSLLGVDHELIAVNLPQREHKSAEFLTLNPFGQIPVLVDGALTIADSTAILVYLAKKYGRTDWLPDTPEGAARVQRWLSVASGEVAFGRVGQPVRAAEFLREIHKDRGRVRNRQCAIH